MAYEGFDALKAKLGKKKGITNPGGLAATIGRRKYGKAKFNKFAAKGKSMRGVRPQKATTQIEALKGI